MISLKKFYLGSKAAAQDIFVCFGVYWTAFKKWSKKLKILFLIIDIPRKSINGFETSHIIEYCIIKNKLMAYSGNTYEKKKSLLDHFVKINWNQRARH